MIKILAIETSCDDTAIAVISDSTNVGERIIAQTISTQIKEHQIFGGVIPELAARAHLESISPILNLTLNKANLTLNEIDAIAVTSGPGLVGGLITGLMFAKGLSLSLNKPLYAINHLEGHALTARLSHGLEFPYLLLLASGGHCQFIEVLGVGKYNLLGGTIDDAAGECFDKVAKLLGLDFPGGPALAKLAEQGNSIYELPLPLSFEKNCNFSFSGLKTAAANLIKKICLEHSKNPEHSTNNDLTINNLSVQIKADIAASLQSAISKIMVIKVKRAVFMCNQNLSQPPIKQFVMAGGVAANKYIRSNLQQLCEQLNLIAILPPPELCTDNAAMIGWAAIERIHAEIGASDLAVLPNPRWSLADLNINEIVN